MSKQVYYSQCKLKRGNTETVCWIPEKYAIIGKVVKLKGLDEEWEEGWVVEQSYSRVLEENLPDSHKEIKAHKKRTGDSLPN